MSHNPFLEAFHPDALKAERQDAVRATIPEPPPPPAPLPPLQLWAGFETDPPLKLALMRLGLKRDRLDPFDHLERHASAVFLFQESALPARRLNLPFLVRQWWFAIRRATDVVALRWSDEFPNEPEGSPSALRLRMCKDVLFDFADLLDVAPDDLPGLALEAGVPLGPLHPDAKRLAAPVRGSSFNA